MGEEVQIKDMEEKKYFHLKLTLFLPFFWIFVFFQTNHHIAIGIKNQGGGRDGGLKEGRRESEKFLQSWGVGGIETQRLLMVKYDIAWAGLFLALNYTLL